ncbi:transmembrane protein 151B-like [Haliotis cracherodii]|uniref:transmembrane protein 151B-like n=1 Tax=Haliotis cracherodii TaxID=6455 RepID=UPI0039E99872
MQTELGAQENEQRPIKQSFCGSLRRDAHWKCLILTLLIYGCLSAIAWCRLAVVKRVIQEYYSFTRSHIDRTSPCNDGYIYIPVAFVIMLYLVYLVECWHSHTRIELQYKVDINSVYDKVLQMKDAIPIIWWKAICYHYVRRTRQVTRYRNGDAFTSTQVYYERVNSCTAGSAFNFTHCGVKDISKSLVGLEEYPATKIRFTKGFSFSTIESECEFEDQRAQFFQDYESRDDYMEGREGMDLLNVNFKEYMIAFADPDNLPWYVSHVIFWLGSFLLLSWPLRVIIEYKTAHLHYHVHKLFGTNLVNQPNPISRVSTMNSTDLEMNIRNNNAIVPSYSEAMLLEPSLQRFTSDANGNISSSGSATPRSLTFSALPPSRSSGFIRAFFSRDVLSNVRRYNSCTAITGNTRMVSRADDNLSGNEDDDINNSGSNRRRRRRKRRKRPTSSITFAPAMRNTVLPPTPETPEDHIITMHPSASSVSMSRLSSRGGLNDNPSFVQDSPRHVTHNAVNTDRRPTCPVNGNQTSGVRPLHHSNSYDNPLMSSVDQIDTDDMQTSGTGDDEPPPPHYEEALQMQRVNDAADGPPTQYPVGEEAAGQGQDNRRLLSPNTAQRHYRTIHCMETSL